MNIRKIQQSVADKLNGCQKLISNHCKAFAEDLLTVQDNLFSAISSKGMIGICVVTPSLMIDGCSADGLPVGVKILVRCIEAPALRKMRNGFTALDAAEAAAHHLHGYEMGVVSIDQAANERTGTVTATAEFELSTILIDE